MKLPRQGIAGTEDEAVSLGAEIGFPLVLKIVSEFIAHKSDVGGVKLNLNSESEIRKACTDLCEKFLILEKLE